VTQGFLRLPELVPWKISFDNMEMLRRLFDFEIKFVTPQLKTDNDV
jgi:hypothetical protein